MDVKKRYLSDALKKARDEIYERDKHIGNSTKNAINEGRDVKASANDPAWKKQAIEEYKQQHTYNVTDENGNVVGRISQNAKDAIEQGRLFKYSPRNIEEQKAFSYLRKKQNDEERRSERTTNNYRNITSNRTFNGIPNLNDKKQINDAYKQVTNSEIVNLNDKKQVKNTYNQLTQSSTNNKNKNQSVNNADKKTDNGDKASFGSWMGSQIMSGVAQFNKGVFSTLDFVLPTEFLGRYDYVSNLNDYYGKLNDDYGKKAQQASESRGKGWKLAGDVLSSTIAAVPDAVLAYMTAGTSLGASAAGKALPVVSNGSVTAAAFRKTVNSMMKNPMYWTSVLRTLGTDYEEAKERGANDLVAASTAIITTALNAGIEVGGGIEKLPEKLKSDGKNVKDVVYEWAKSALEEGNEEVLQGITTNAVAKIMYDHKAPIVSLSDDNAVINPLKSAKEFGMGAAVGGLLGGAQTAATSAANTADVIKTGKLFSDPSAIQTIINTGLDSPTDSKAYKLAAQAQNKKSKPSNYEVGRMFYANAEQINKEMLTYSEAADAKSTPVLSASDTAVVTSGAATEAVTPNSSSTVSTVVPSTDTKTDTSGELSEIMNSEPIKTFTPKTASDDIKRLENILIAKGADDKSRQGIIGTALEVEKALGGTDKAIRSVFDKVSKITSDAIGEIQNKAGLSGAYWKLFGENFKSLSYGNTGATANLVTEYANAYAEAMKKSNPERYNSVMVGLDGIDLSSELPRTIMQNVIPQNVRNADGYRNVASQIKNIVNNAGIQLKNERTEIYNVAGKTTLPVAEKTTVYVGEKFKDTKTGNTITVVSRDAENTIVEIDTGIKIETRRYPNSRADTLATNEQFEQMESSEVVSPEDAQRYNIVVSNLKRKAEELGLLDNNFFTALQNVNLYNPSASDRALISTEFRRVFAGNTDPLVTDWLNAINVDAQPVTSVNEQNMPVSTENDPANEYVTNIDVDMAKGEILSLKHTKNIYAAFKDAKKVVVGDGIITDGYFGLPLTDKNLEAVKKVYDGEITEMQNLKMSKFYNPDNDVVIQGNPIVDDTTEMTFYVFTIDGKYYVAQQKYIDAVNKKDYVIKANSQSVAIPWTVHDGEGNLIAILCGAKPSKNADVVYGNKQTVEEILEMNRQKKEAKAAEKAEADRRNAEFEESAAQKRNAELERRKSLSTPEEINSLKEKYEGKEFTDGENTYRVIYHPDRAWFEFAIVQEDGSLEHFGAELIEPSSAAMEQKISLLEKFRQNNAKNKEIARIEEVKRAEAQAKKDEEEKHINSYVSGMKPMTAAKIKNTLLKDFDTDVKLHKFVENAVKNGQKLEAKDVNGKKSYRLYKDGSLYYEINKTAYDYGKYIESISEDAESGIKSDKTVTEPTESVIKKAYPVTETPENVADTEEAMPVGQLLEDYNGTVDNILSVSDETAKEFADKRVAVEVLKNTPTVILDNVEDARDLKVIINYNKLYLAVRKSGVFKGHYHNLGADIAKRLPEFLNTPDAIIQIANGRLNLFATVVTERGNNGIVSVELNSTKDINGKYEDYNVVVTMFSSDDNYAQNLISGDGVTVKYKREDLSQVNPQLYKWLAIINDKSSIDNIVSQDNDIVNSSVRSDTENDAESQQKDSSPSTYNVAYFDDLSASIRKGESVSLKDVRAAVDAILLNHGEAIKAELSQLKNDELKKHLSVYNRGRVTKKAEMVDSIYTDMLSSLYYALSGKDTITYIYDGSGFDSQQSKMLFDVSRELTEETFSKRLAENAEKYQKQVAAREEKMSKVKNPQTLEDYAYKKRYFGLSEEETIQYENLYAEERRKARENKKSAKTIKDTSGADAFFANTDNYTIEKTTHTKTGEDVWVIRPASRLETEQWKQLNEQMKALGGSYWRGNQGWNFKKDPTAALSSTEESETETAKGSTNAEKLRAVAEGMQKAIDDKFRDRLTNTAKRAREAASAEVEGERLKRLQDTINNIADALENGENTLLDKIDSKAQVETLMSMLRTGRRNRISETLPDITYDERLQEQDKPYSNDDAKYAEYPLTKLHESAITEYIRAAEGKTGYKQITDRLKKSLKSVKNGYVTVDAQMFADIDKIVQNLSTYRADFWNDGVAERKRLARMGIENVVELRAYLREFIKFLPGKDADAERQRNIKAKERQLANAKIEGFFPTPKAIVEKMLDEADIKPGEKVLEPSAGKGNIADAIRESYPDNALDVVEWNASLNELLSEKGHNVVGVDFLQHSGEYDKIIMNPPFEKGQDIDHIRHAYSLLKDGGRVVCVMSEGPFYRNDKKATEFREWLDSLGGVSEKLPEGAFKNAERSTGVNTRLVVIDKVASETKPTKSKSGVKSSRDNATESSRADRWSTDRVDNGKENKSAVSVSEIIEQISTEFGIPISTGKVTDSEASGIYKEKPETIRTRISNNLPTISHELGHHLDKKYNLNELGSVDSIRAIVSDEFLDQYPDDAVNGELVAEFVRRYLKNSNEANRLCPEFYNDFVRTLSKEDLAAVNRVAKQVNEYLSYDIDKRYESSVISAKKAKKMQKLPFAERWKNLYTGLVDKFHPLKQITDYVSEIKGSELSGIKNAYVLATNSLNAHTIANYQVLEGFRDLNGNFVDDAKSLIECIGMVNSKDITTLDLYLKLKHALEVIGKGKRVFADEVLEDTDNIKKKIAEIEKEHPEMVEAANNLYEFQYNMLKHFAVPSGIMTMEQVEYLHHEYPCYVPFYRFIKNKKGGMFAKSSFVNQGSPIMRQTGSGLDTLSHLESIIRNVEKIVKASTRNQTAAVLGSYADNVDGIGQFIEKVAPDMLPHTIDITTLKENFAKRLQDVVKSGDDFFAISGLMDEVFGDDVTDFTPIANESKKIISVMRGGERSYYQIHDDALFSAVAELSPQQVNGWIRVNNMIMQPMKLLITQNNPIFAATNALRDFGTAYKLSEIKNPLTFVVQYAKALGGIITNSEDYKKYKAMGGGHSSELSANIENISKTLRRVAEKDMGKARRLAYSIFRHPVDTVASINDAVESIPRFMEFERTLKENGDLQKAIFNASDITTNFKRSGSSNTAKFVNSSIMFNNAAIQGLDKMFRTITAKDPKKRYATLTKWLLHALIMGILGYLYNKEVDEEGYKNLSSYKKNNFYNFAIGDGKFISLPKPRENALLDTVTERTIEYLFGDNEEAFYDFGSYLGSQLLPPMLPDTLDPVNAAHSVLSSTVLGGIVDVGFNQDFKGTPIEGAYDKYTPSNERYTESTTKIAYALGQTKLARDMDMSPKKIDHLISSYTGILGQVNKALFPMNESRRDASIGLRNKFISDSNYSTDVLNTMYENEEKAEKAFNYSRTIDTAIEYEKNAVITSYISGMNKAIKALPEEKQRNGRAYLLKTLNSWNYEDTASQSNMLSSLEGSTVSENVIFTELPSSTLEWSENKQKYVYQMTPQEYYKYVNDYMSAIEDARKEYGCGSIENCEKAKEAAKDYMSKYKKNVLKKQYLNKAVPKTE